MIESFYNSGKPVAAVCHSPAVFHRVMFQGEPLVKGKRVTGFTNGEEGAVKLTHVVTFLVEDELKRIGALYEKAADWASFAVVDGRVVTGQTPASSTAATLNSRAFAGTLSTISEEAQQSVGSTAFCSRV